jgi:L-fuconolactonase
MAMMNRVIRFLFSAKPANLSAYIVALSLFTLGLHGHAAEPALSIIDCHVHLWDFDRREGLSWIAKDHPVLSRSFLPKHHMPIAKANSISGVIVVQAGQSLDDNQWNLDITAEYAGLYRGVVGNLSKVIATDAFEPTFTKLCKDPRYVGYRLSGRSQRKIDDALIRDLKATAASGRTLDVLAGDYSLADVAVIAERVPDLKIIINHFGNVVLTDGPLDPGWVEQFRNVAKHRNVYCKVSALYGRFKNQPAPKEHSAYTPILELALDAFGEERLIFGSDWPVSESTGDMASLLTITRTFIEAKGATATQKLFHDNAVRFYGIKWP